MMTGDEEGDVKVRRTSVSSAIGGFALVLGCLLSTAAGAAGSSSRTHVPELGTFLASANVLSEAAMARQSGTGLPRPPIITDEQGAAPKVQLWDELKIGPLAAPVTSGITNGGNMGK
jgi:hypothetical protein